MLKGMVAARIKENCQGRVRVFFQVLITCEWKKGKNKKMIPHLIRLETPFNYCMIQSPSNVYKSLSKLDSVNLDAFLESFQTRVIPTNQNKNIIPIYLYNAPFSSVIQKFLFSHFENYFQVRPNYSAILPSELGFNS